MKKRKPEPGTAEYAPDKVTPAPFFRFAKPPFHYDSACRSTSGVLLIDPGLVGCQCRRRR